MVKKMNNQECQNYLCTQLDHPIQTRKDWRKWALRHHPDKGGNEEYFKQNFDKMETCLDQLNVAKVNCPGPSSPPAQSTSPPPPPPTPPAQSTPPPPPPPAQPSPPKSEPNQETKQSLQKKANCARMYENWSFIQKHQRFDKAGFNANLIKEELSTVSPKMEALLNNIEKLDQEDLQKHGKLFKHFIFSDVKRMGYGAKIIASSLVAAGFEHCFSKEKSKLNIVQPKSNSGKKTFALLSSVALFDKKIPVKAVKEMLKMYNQRPENIHGDNVRFIVLDSGFKEGIDLYDVKYVHIFENPRTKADEKQTIGRATRNCGQKGLNF